MYKDPLHVPYQDLCVMYDGKEMMMLNKALLDRQNAWGNLEEIKEVHWLKICIYHLLDAETDIELMRSYAKDLEQIEFKLQELWGFEANARYHRFWEYPKCSCPEMDNRDSYPHRSYITDACVLHGGFIVTTSA